MIFFRFLAITLVTTFHVARWAGVSPGNWNGFLMKGWAGVGLFFVISGYCMGWSTKNIRNSGFNFTEIFQYLKNRFWRIAPAYYVSILFWIIAIRCLGIAVKNTGSFDIITHVLFIHNLFDNTFFSISGVFWSLATEMQFYLVLPFIIPLMRTVRISLSILLVLAVLSILINLFFERVVLVWGVIPYMFLFLFGWIINVYGHALERYLKGYTPLVLLLLIVIWLYFFSAYGYNAKKIFEYILSAALGLIVLWVKTNHEPKIMKLKFITFIAQSSFSIYLYNYIIYIFGENGKPWMIIPITLFTFLFGSLMYFLCERNFEAKRKHYKTTTNGYSHITA